MTKKGKSINLNAAVTTTSTGVFKFTLTAGKGEYLQFSFNFLIRLFFSNQVSLDLNYTILGTDYTSYAVASACATVPKIGDIQIFWIYSSQRTLSPANLKKAMAVFTANSLDSSSLVDVTQSGCNN